MQNQPAQPFCTNCGQYLPVDAAQCPRCGVAVGAPPVGSYGQPSPAYGSPPNAGGASPNARERRLQRRARGQQPRSRLRGCGCALLLLLLLAAPIAGIALTHGQTQMLLIYIAAGLVGLVVLVLVIAALFTRRGREAAGEIVAEGCAEGCLEALLGGLFGG